MPETKTPARRRPAAKRAAEPIDGVVVTTDGPDVLRIKTGSRKPGRRVVMFYIDGTAHSVPEQPPGNITLGYLDVLRQAGSLAANAYLLEEMLGPESYQALRSCKDMTQKQLSQVMDKVIAIVAAELADPKDEP